MNMSKSYGFVLAALLVVGCNDIRYQELNYHELRDVMTKNKDSPLCNWYYDAISSNRDQEYLYIYYICFPSANYRGSEFSRKISIKVRKELMSIRKGIEGPIGLDDLRSVTP
jgi:hypothetical protein